MFQTQKTAVIYSRTASPQVGNPQHSIRGQQECCKQFARQHKFTVLKEFCDEGKSGASAVERHGLAQALKFAKENKAHALIVRDTDRLSRSMDDFLKIRGFLTKNKISLLSVNQPAIDETAEGKLLETMMAAINDFQAKLIGKRVKYALRKIAENGGTPHAAPYGYKKIPSSQSGEVKVEAKEADAIKQIFKLYGTGSYTLSALAKELNRRGASRRDGKPITLDMVAGILRNPYYIGQLRHANEYFIGRHAVLVSREDFDACQRLLQERRHQNKKKASTN